MNDIIVAQKIDFQSLYGKEVQQFHLKATASEFNAKFQPIVIDNIRPQFSPADGCNIIIGGSSTNASRIFGLEGYDITNNVQFTFFNGIFVASFIGYCNTEEKDIVERDFKLFIRPHVFNFCKKQQAQLSALLSSYI
jgi:hypothetical protein